MTNLHRALLLTVCLPLAGFAQRGLAAEPQLFETASIRPVHVTAGCFSMLPPGGSHYEVTCVTLRYLIEMAYDSTELEGGGKALDGYFDLRATVPEGTSWTVISVRPMLRQLLAERFHLVVRQGRREKPGYAMLVAKGGPKLEMVPPETRVEGQQAGKPAQNFMYPGRLQGRALDAAGIADFIGYALHAPVRDRTGLVGRFNIAVNYAPENSASSTLPTFFVALEEQLGLRLQPERIGVDTFTIEHVDDAPTPN